MPDDLVGAKDIAEMLGVTRQRVDQLLRDDPTFPRPRATLGMRIWDRAAVVKWAKANGRKVRGG